MPSGHASVNVEVLIVAGAISLLKAAVMIVLLTGTPVALLTGATAVTVGTSTAIPPVPRIGSRPWSPPPPQPANDTVSSIPTNQVRFLKQLSNFFIICSLNLFQETVYVMKQPASARMLTFCTSALVSLSKQVGSCTQLTISWSIVIAGPDLPEENSYWRGSPLRLTAIVAPGAALICTRCSVPR